MLHLLKWVSKSAPEYCKYINNKYHSNYNVKKMIIGHIWYTNFFVPSPTQTQNLVWIKICPIISSIAPWKQLVIYYSVLFRYLFSNFQHSHIIQGFCSVRKKYLHLIFFLSVDQFEFPKTFLGFYSNFS